MKNSIFKGNIKGFSTVITILLTIGACLIVVGVGIVLFALINGDGGTKQSITLDRNKLEMIVGEKVLLEAKVVPSSAEVKWTSNNLNVSVDDNGTVIAKETGTSTIYASIVDGPSAKCEVIITSDEEEPPIKEVTVSLSPRNKTIKVGDTLQLVADIEGSNDNPEWVSTNTDIATVTASGLVEGLAEGEVTIRAKVEDAIDEVKVYITNEDIEPEVTPEPTPEITPEVTPEPVPSETVGKQFTNDYVKLSTTELIIDKGETISFDIEMTNAAGAVSFTQKDTSIVTLDTREKWMESDNQKTPDKQTIKVTGVDSGTTTIVVNLVDVSSFDKVLPISEKATIIVTVR